MRVIFLGFMLVLPVMLFVSCKKDKDETVPMVTFEEPFENSLFHVYDTIVVKAKIQDESQIVSVSLTLTDDQYKPVGRSYTFPEIQNPMHLYSEYFVDNRYLPSGNYFLLIEVSDGYNIKTKYQKIRLAGIPRVLTGLITVQQNHSWLTATYYKTDGSDTSIYHGQRDFVSSAVSSKYQQLLLVGAQNDAIALSLDKGKLLWSVPSVPNPPIPYFAASAYHDNLFYLAYYDGRMEALSHQKVVQRSFPALTHYKWTRLFFEQDFVFAYQRHQSNPNLHQLGMYYQHTGAQHLVHTFSKEIVGVARRNADEVLLFKSGDTAAAVEVFTPSINSGWESKTINEAIQHAIGISEDDFIIASESRLYWYRYASSTLFPWVENVHAKKVLFDDIDQVVYVVESNQIKGYSFPSGQLVSTVDLPNIVDAHLVYSI